MLEFWLRLGVDGVYLPGVRRYRGAAVAPGRVNDIVNGTCCHHVVCGENNLDCELFGIGFTLCGCHVLSPW